jgi:hypothetical protein
MSSHSHGAPKVLKVHKRKSDEKSKKGELTREG